MGRVGHYFVGLDPRRTAVRVLCDLCDIDISVPKADASTARARPLVCRFNLVSHVQLCCGLGRIALHGGCFFSWCRDGCPLVQSRKNGHHATPCFVADHAGIFLKYRFKNELGNGRCDGVCCGCHFAIGIGLWKVSWCSHCWQGY